jgi:outer membrane protein OmpA-like peptidoglycan-associated protein
MTFTSKLYDLKTGVQENDPAGLLNPKNIVYKKHVIPEKKTTETSFPVGGGLRYRFLPKWSVYLESTLRNINTDKLDNWDDAVTEHDKYQYTCIGITYNFKALSDSLIDSKLKAKYDLQKKPRESKSKVESRIDSLEKILGDLGHRLGNIEENSKDINDSLKIIEERLVQTVPQTGLNTMMFTPTDAVTQLLVVFFDFNKYDIKEVYRKNIALVARILKSDPGIHVQIIGHADRVGSEKYNMALSKKRAMAVANELKNAYGINPDRVTDIVVKGKSDPLSSKYDDVNRRVDFIFTKPKK